MRAAPREHSLAADSCRASRVCPDAGRRRRVTRERSARVALAAHKVRLRHSGHLRWEYSPSYVIVIRLTKMCLIERMRLTRHHRVRFRTDTVRVARYPPQ